MLDAINRDGELVLTTYTSYVPSRYVYGTVPVSILEPKGTVAKPILDGQYYRRSDALVVRAFQPMAFNIDTQTWRAFTVSPYNPTATLRLITKNQSSEARPLLHEFRLHGF